MRRGCARWRLGRRFRSRARSCGTARRRAGRTRPAGHSLHLVREQPADPASRRSPPIIAGRRLRRAGLSEFVEPGRSGFTVARGEEGARSPPCFARLAATPGEVHAMTATTAIRAAPPTWCATWRRCMWRTASPVSSEAGLRRWLPPHRPSAHGRIHRRRLAGVAPGGNLAASHAPRFAAAPLKVMLA